MVVGGGGLAGRRTAEELRARGYAGAVTLVGAEKRPPYDRPPLSKRLMTGELADTTLRDDLDALGAQLRLGEAATGLQPGDLRGGGLRTHRGGYGSDRLVPAPRAPPVAPPGPRRPLVPRARREAAPRPAPLPS